MYRRCTPTFNSTSFSVDDQNYQYYQISLICIEQFRMLNMWMNGKTGVTSHFLYTLCATNAQ
jgi:hypothetical protein